MTFRSSAAAMRFLTHLTKKLDPVSSIISSYIHLVIFCAFFRALRASSANEQTRRREDLTTRDFYFRTLRLVDRIEDQKLAFCCVEFFYTFFTAEMSKEPVIKRSSTAAPSSSTPSTKQDF